jgi:hypothetical protein
MTAVLLVYLILMPNHQWAFLLAEPAESRSFCEMESAEVAAMLKDEPGNMRIICVEDERVQI